MSVQCLNHTGTIVCLTILLNKIKLQHFQDRVNMGLGCLFLDNAKELFGSSWENIRPSISHSL